MVRPLRSAGEQRVQQLTPSVEEAAGVAAGGAVAQRQLELGKREPGAGGVDRGSDFTAEAGGERKARGTSVLGERPLSREWFDWNEAGPCSNQCAGGALRDPEAYALPLDEDGDREIRAALEQRPEVAVEIGVAQQQRPRRRSPLRKRQRLTLSARGQAEDAGPGALGDLRRSVARAVVGDDHLGFRKLLP